MRRRKAKKIAILPDPKFNDKQVTKFVNNMMLDGKKNLSFKTLLGIVPCGACTIGKIVAAGVLVKKEERIKLSTSTRLKLERATREGGKYIHPL